MNNTLIERPGSFTREREFGMTDSLPAARPPLNLQSILCGVHIIRVRPALVNGAAGMVVTLRGRPFAVMGFIVVDGRIVEIDAIADPERVRRIAVAVLSSDE